MWSIRGLPPVWKQLRSRQDIKPGHFSSLAVQFTKGGFFSRAFHGTFQSDLLSAPESCSLTSVSIPFVQSTQVTAGAPGNVKEGDVLTENITMRPDCNPQVSVSGLLLSERDSHRYDLAYRSNCWVPTKGYQQTGVLWGHRSLATEAVEKKKRGRPRKVKEEPIAPPQPSLKPQGPLPTFEDCLRRFAPKIDALDTVPAGGEALKKMLAINNASVTKLLAFLDSIQPQAKGYPRAAFYDLDFFMVEGEAIQNVRLKFKTTGGDCKNQVQKDFERFFQKCGVAQSFRWPTGSWGALHIHGGEGEEELREKARLIKQSHMEQSTDGSSKGGEDGTAVDQGGMGGEDVVSLNPEVPQAEKKKRRGRKASTGSDSDQGHGIEKQGEERKIGRVPGAGGVEILDRSDPRYGEHGSVFSAAKVSPSEDKESEEGVFSIEELISALDPTLKLIAEFPWGTASKKKVVLEMLESFRKSSPLLGEAIVGKVWKGTLSLPEVCEGLSRKDAAIATSIVFHVHRNIERKGRPKTWEKELREKARLIKESHTEHGTDGSSNGGESGTATNQRSMGGEDAVSPNPELPQAEKKKERGRKASAKNESDQGPGVEKPGEGQETGKVPGIGGGTELTDSSDPRYVEYGSLFSAPKVSPMEGSEEKLKYMKAEFISNLDERMKMIAEFPWPGMRSERKVVLEMVKTCTPLLREVIAEKVWKGTLSVPEVCEGLCKEDAAIARIILFHVHRTIEERGRPKKWPKQTSWPVASCAL